MISALAARVRRIAVVLAILVAVLLGLRALFPSDTTAAVTFTVNTPANTDDGSCDELSLLPPEDCTLHEAIDAANANPGTDIIDFLPPVFTANSPGVIDLSWGLGQLPAITEDLTIDATSAGVVLDGGTATSEGLTVKASHDGFDFALLSGGGTFAIRELTGDGIVVVGLGFALDGVIIEGVTISDIDGTGVDLGDTPNVRNGSISSSDIRAGGDGVHVSVSGTALRTDSFTISRNTITSTLGDGIDINANPANLTIAAITDNTISGGLGDGVRIDVDPTGRTIATISRNDIATGGADGIDLCCGDFAGSTISENALKGNAGAGILIDSASNLIIGPNNVISHNSRGGVVVLESGLASGADGNTMTRNSIYDNGGLGIDLDDDGVRCGTYGSPNECLKSPHLEVLVGGQLFGDACAGCRVEVFLADDIPEDQDDTNGDPHGEGREFLTSGTADESGVFSIELCGPEAGELTTTATNELGSTSEFSENLEFAGAGEPCPTPTATATPTATPVSVGGVAVYPDIGGQPLETGDSSRPNDGVVAGVIAAVAAGVVALGGAAWCARRR